MYKDKIALKAHLPGLKRTARILTIHIFSRFILQRDKSWQET
ncbi:MAG: hypothetical protein PUG36_02250 [Clostridiales bacterium]|nr:hypothetical protein [Clostridiales bacterium]